ncbi:hypothetical protein LTR95_006697 [Oleoguttula sp. CCFEE 5521]
MTTLRPSDTGSFRQSPFRRQNSVSPAPGLRPSTPSSSPTKSPLSPVKATSLSPEKASPFTRRPSQNGAVAERPSSPFARPTSGLGLPASPKVPTARKASVRSGSDKSAETVATPPVSPTRRVSPPDAAKENIPERSHSPDMMSPSRLDGSKTYADLATASPSTALPSSHQQSFASRPTAVRIPTSSTVSTIRQPIFAPSTSSHNTTKPDPRPQPRAVPTSSTATLQSSLRQSFAVLDPSGTGSLTPSTLPSTLTSLGLPTPTPAELSTYFPRSQPQSLTLQYYLSSLSSLPSSLSSAAEQEAAFGAWDTDDSGQIDLEALREAVMRTGPEAAGDEDFRLSEREAEEVLAGFAGRRAFGKGLGGKGEVFRWREFVGALGGGVGGEGVEA